MSSALALAFWMTLQANFLPSDLLVTWCTVAKAPLPSSLCYRGLFTELATMGDYALH